MKRMLWATVTALMMVGSSVLMGCGNDAHEAGQHESHAVSHDARGGFALSLNDGAKWEMDDHTRTMVAKLNATIAEAHVATLADAQSLGQALKDGVGQLIEGCTMQGAAHDQLHVFLAEFIPTVDGLAEATDLKSGHEALGRIQALFAEYNKAFE